MGRTVFACGAFLFLMSCVRFPVEVYNPYSAQGEPQPLAVVAEPTITFPTGSATAADGTTAPIYRTQAADDARPPAPAPEPFPWASILNIALGALGVTGMIGGGWGMLAAKVAQRALRAAAEYGDRVEEVALANPPVHTGDEALARLTLAAKIRQAKLDAREAQLRAGVHQVIQKARGKK